LVLDAVEEEADEAAGSSNKKPVARPNTNSSRSAPTLLFTDEGNGATAPPTNPPFAFGSTAAEPPFGFGTNTETSGASASESNPPFVFGSTAAKPPFGFGTNTETSGASASESNPQFVFGSTAAKSPFAFGTTSGASASETTGTSAPGSRSSFKRARFS
jgi:hypothetical protein